MAEGVYKITEQFEDALCRYTGAPYAVTVDNASNALFLALTYDLQRVRRWRGDPRPEVAIPARTYPSVPCEIIHAGGRVRWLPVEGTTLRGAYPLGGTRVWDSALRFTAGMYVPDAFMCISFTGPYKHLKLSKGGAILTDDPEAAAWFKRARYSGRRECSYHKDEIDMLGWNFYMMPEIAARGLLMMAQFYGPDGTPRHNDDLEIAYPDLSRFAVYGGTTEIREKFNPGVRIPSGETITLTGEQWLLIFAEAGFDWAIRDLNKLRKEQNAR